MTLEQILAERPSPGQPRTYRFPAFERAVLPSGLQVLTVHVPGRPLVSANLVFLRGAGDEPGDLAGATVLAARDVDREHLQARRQLRPFEGRKAVGPGLARRRPLGQDLFECHAAVSSPVAPSVVPSAASEAGT